MPKNTMDGQQKSFKNNKSSEPKNSHPPPPCLLCCDGSLGPSVMSHERICKSFYEKFDTCNSTLFK